jgi:hypothetical protein
MNNHSSRVVPSQSSAKMSSDDVGRRTDEDSLSDGFDEDAIRQARLRRENFFSSSSRAILGTRHRNVK